MMVLARAEDALHKAQLLRLLCGLLDDPDISQSVYFKGGTCAGLLGFLDRFSIDLDFDLKDNSDKVIFDRRLRRIFNKLKLKADRKSRNSLFYVLKYKAERHLRNSIKLSFIEQKVRSNIYAVFKLEEIDRLARCQTIETMFANKLVAVTDRYKKREGIAGRDIYDIHHFFLSGYKYEPRIIRERTGKEPGDYLKELVGFIEERVNEKILTQDLNFLLPSDKFKLISTILKRESLMFIRDQIGQMQVGRGDI